MKNMKNYSNESCYTVCPTTKEELKEIIKKTIKEKDNKCDLNFIDTSKITDMSFLFSPGGGGFNKFDGDISSGMSLMLCIWLICLHFLNSMEIFQSGMLKGIVM